jgi:hypothetical protein
MKKVMSDKEWKEFDDIVSRLPNLYDRDHLGQCFCKVSNQLVARLRELHEKLVTK